MRESSPTDTTTGICWPTIRYLLIAGAQTECVTILHESLEPLLQDRVRVCHVAFHLYTLA